MMLAATALLCGCNEKEGQEDNTPLNANFTIMPEQVYAGDAVTLEAQVSGGKTPYTYKWTIANVEQEKTNAKIVYTFTQSGTAIVVLDVKDAKGATAQKKKVVAVNAAKIPEAGDLEVKWAGRMGGYNTKSAAAVANDGSVYTTCRDNKLYKWNSNGQIVWSKEIFKPTANAESVTYGTPSIDSDGTVFIGAGSHTASGNTSSDGCLKAFNPDGSIKWTFSQWYRSDGTTPAPTCMGTIVAIDVDNVYFGCTGQNGIVLSANKASGARNGFLAPAGGARSGMAISKNGLVHWFGGKYGIFGIEKTVLDAGGAEIISSSKWRTFGSGDEAAVNTYEGQIACLTVGGEPCAAGIITDAVGTRVYAVKTSDGSVVCSVRIDDTNSQDQGGVVADKDGNIVASLANTAATENGGIVIVDPSTQQIVARYRTQEKVSGSPAVDAAGNIHFGTESGFYYIVKRNGSVCELLVKRDLAALISADSRYTDTFKDADGNPLAAAKIWSSPVIGDDGRIYICFTEANKRKYGGVVCLGYAGCTGPADSDWPMMGHDRRHTGKQL